MSNQFSQSVNSSFKKIFVKKNKLEELINTLLKDQFSSEILLAIEIDYGNVGYIPEHTDTRSDRNKYPNACSYIIPQEGGITIHTNGNSTNVKIGSTYMLDIYSKPHSATVLNGTKCIHVVTTNPNEKTFT